MSDAPAAVIRPDWRAVVAFLVLAFGLAWLVAMPLWLSPHGLNDPLAAVLLPLMMTTPAIATLVTLRLVSRPATGIRRATGLRLGRGWVRVWLLAWFGTIGLVAAAPFVAAAFGAYRLDLAAFSGLTASLTRQGIDLPADGLRGVILAQLALLPLAPLINAPFSFGEEWGWRGFLLPALLPLGTWPALILSGVVWGLWHLPVILLGYNYPDHRDVGWLLMTATCVIWGVLFGWTRLATGSVWPAVIAHGALNGTAGITMALAHVDSTMDSALVGVGGVTGWLLPLLVILVLVVMRLPGMPVRERAADR